MGVNKQDPVLHSIMSKAVRALTTQDMENAYQKWVVLKFQHEVDYGQLWLYGGLILIGVLLVLYWNIKLRSLNRQLAASHQSWKTPARNCTFSP